MRTSRRNTFKAQSQSRTPVPGKKAPRPAIFTVETKADGNGVMFRQGKKRAEIGEMKLAIGIGKRDTVVGGRFKAGPQGGAVSQVGLVP
jgi:hypothetical protein